MQHKIHPAKGPIHAAINIPGSKSITLRAILLSALADGVSELTGMCVDHDILAFINTLYQLGIVTQLDEKTRTCIIAGGNGKFPKKQATLWCANSLSITRFLLTACAATPGVYYFDGSTALRGRALGQLINLLHLQSVQFIPTNIHKLPFTLIGVDTLEGGDVILKGKIPSQIVSALLIISPYARSAFNFSILETYENRYIDMTCTMMAEFGVLVHRIHKGQFMVPVPQRYQAKDYVIEPDLSFAAYFFAAAAVTGGEVTIPPIKRAQSKQADIKFLLILEKMGCHIIENHLGLTVQGPRELKGIDISMRNVAEAFLILAVLAPFATTPTRISYSADISTKEYERIKALKSELAKMKIKVEMGVDWIRIFPSTPKGRLVYSQNDDRLGMALAIIGLKVPGVIIGDAEHIIKAQPQFFLFWDQLSEQINMHI